MRLCLALLVLFGATHAAVLSDDGRQAPATARRPPNVIVIFADDLGYADIGPFATRADTARPRTPHLDRMAAEGIRLTSFYAAQAVCSASRAALLTGNYPNRIGIRGALMPKSQIGLSDSEKTIAEVLKPRGYATAIYGKWHLGDNRQFLPTHHGFDEYLGLPYSNDMWPHHPQRKNFFPPLPLIEGDEVAEIDPDQSQLTRRYTERAVRFIERHRDTPFFVYVPHSMPHVPLFASDRFKGTTGGGLYGDVIAEIDWSVGQLLAAVARAGLDEQTLVIFTSDNGPWMSYGNHAGSPGPFREGKGTSFEGGVRVPFIARWPGRIPRGVTTSQRGDDHRPAADAGRAGRRAARRPRRRTRHLAAAVVSRRAVAARRALFLLGRRAACRQARQLEAARPARLSVPRVGGQRRHARQVRAEGAGAEPVRSRQGSWRVHQPRGRAARTSCEPSRITSSALARISATR